MSIRNKLVLIISSVMFLLVTGFSVIIVWQIKAIFTNQIKQSIEDRINYSQELVSFYFGRIQDNTSNLAKDPLLIEALITKDPQKLQQVSDKLTITVDTISIIEIMALMEINGSTCTDRTASQNSLSIVGKDFSDRDYCKGIVKTKEPYLSSVYIGTVTEHPNLALVVPVKNAVGKMIGFVSGVIELSELRGYLWDLQKAGSYIVLLDRYNKPFIDTRVKIDKIAESSEEEILMSQNKAQQGFLTRGDYFIGYHRFDSFTIIYAEPIKIMQTQINNILLVIMPYIILAIIILIGVIVVLITRMMGGLKVISDAAKKITEGKMEIRIDEKYAQSKDEIGILATAFNQMLARLVGVYKDLEEKVKQRTAEVEEKNKKLESSEVELKKALETSERISKLMIGRELKMIELKKQIKKSEGTEI